MSPNSIEDLTDREREILALIGQGLSTSEIAARLYRSTKTVESHRLSLGKKLGARNRVELALIAVESGLCSVGADSVEATLQSESFRRAFREGGPAERALRALDAATATTTGEEFLQALVAEFVTLFDALGCYITKLDPDGMLRSVAAWAPNGPLEGIEYPYSGCPCDGIARGTVGRISTGLTTEYPEIEAFKSLGADGLMMTPLFDSRGERLGTLGVLHGAPPPDPGLFPEMLLRIFAGRAAAELERLARETELQESESRYRLLAEHSSDLVSRISPDAVFTYVSPASRELLGFQPFEMVGRSAFEFVHPDDVERVRRTHEALLHTSDRARIEFRRLRYDGGYRWYEANLHAHHDARTGEVDWVISSSRDIHDRRLAEEQLRQSELVLQQAQAVGHMGSWFIDLKRGIVTWSDETCRIFGVSPGTRPTHEFFLARVHDEDRGRVDEAWQAALKGAPYDVEHRLATQLGEVWVRERAELSFDPDGSPASVLGTVQNISLRKESEIGLARARSLLSQVERSTATCMWEWEPKGGMVHGSPHLSRLLGLPIDALPMSLDRVLARCVHPEDRGALTAALDGAARDQPFSLCVRAMTPGDTPRFLQGSGEPVHDASGRFLRVVGIVRAVDAHAPFAKRESI